MGCLQMKQRTSVAILIGSVAQALGQRTTTVSLISSALILAMPVLTLRAIQGFTELPRITVPAAAVAWAVTPRR